MIILLRTTDFAPHTAAFADRLSHEAGATVCCVVDERKGRVDTGGHDKISLTADACAEMGLYCPNDFGWRCGDYGFYLARRLYPLEKFFWLIEYDVRVGGPVLSAFFDRFAEATDVDMIAGCYRRVEEPWYWTHTMAARGAAVWRCLFPVVRLSASAIDLLQAQRADYGRRWRRRANWSNDESFVATVLSRAGRRCADLNDFGAAVYDEQSFTYAQPFDGAELDERSAPLKLFHPVLFGEDHRRKVERTAWHDKGEYLSHRIKRRLLGALNVRLPA